MSQIFFYFFQRVIFSLIFVSFGATKKLVTHERSNFFVYLQKIFSLLFLKPYTVAPNFYILPFDLNFLSVFFLSFAWDIKKWHFLKSTNSKKFLYSVIACFLRYRKSFECHLLNSPSYFLHTVTGNNNKNTKRPKTLTCYSLKDLFLFLFRE